MSLSGLLSSLGLIQKFSGLVLFSLGFLVVCTVGRFGE